MVGDAVGDVVGDMEGDMEGDRVGDMDGESEGAIVMDEATARSHVHAVSFTVTLKREPPTLAARAEASWLVMPLLGLNEMAKPDCVPTCRRLLFR
jgi:chorismate mutase